MTNHRVLSAAEYLACRIFFFSVFMGTRLGDGTWQSFIFSTARAQSVIERKRQQSPNSTAPRFPVNGLSHCLGSRSRQPKWDVLETKIQSLPNLFQAQSSAVINCSISACVWVMDRVRVWRIKFPSNRSRTKNQRITLGMKYDFYIKVNYMYSISFQHCCLTA